MEEPLLHNPYKTLNVPKDAPLATIRSAHRKLVLACHPDKVQDESAKKIKAEQFHQVQQAYEVLSDEIRRQRYDDKVKLAQLRAEMNTDRGPPRRSESYQSPRYSGNSPVFEVRNGRVYEERVPGGRSHVFDEDIFASKFAEARPSSKKFDEMFSEAPPSNQRRTSGRQGDDRRRMYEAEEERSRRERDVRKAKEAAAREEKERRRTKDRRRDMEAKSSRKFSTHMDTDSDSEMDDRRYSGKRDATPPKRRYEEPRRKSEWDVPRRSSKREDLRRDRSKDFDEDSIEASIAAAQEHMSRSRETFREVEIEPRSRPSRKRADSNLERATPIPPPMPPRPVDNRRRSSDRERSDKERSGRSGGESDRRDDHRRAGRGSRRPSPVRRDSGKKDKKYREPEIVEPVSSGRKASLPIFGSDGKGFKEKMFGSSSSKKEAPRRSATNHPPPPSPTEFKHPGMRRAETMPINNMRRHEPIPLKSSHLKNTKAPPSDDDTSSSDDSDSSDATNETPEIVPRNATTHKYKVNTDPEAQSPRTIYMEPDDLYDSPKARHSAERPRMAGRGSSSRAPPSSSRAMPSYTDDRPPRPSNLSRETSSRNAPPAPPPLKTTASTRGSGGMSKKLFGAVDEDDEVARFMQSSTASPKVSSPKMAPADVRYSSKPRRGTTEDVDRDAFPGSLHRGHRRPSYQRGETAF